MYAMRKLLNLFLVVSLLVAQGAGYAHALSHAEHNLSVAHWSEAHPKAHTAHDVSHEACDDHGDDAPQLDHSKDSCIAFLALTAAACGSLAVVTVPPIGFDAPTWRKGSFSPQYHVPFSSRAPPAFTS
jgi:hypothetical protein